MASSSSPSASRSGAGQKISERSSSPARCATVARFVGAPRLQHSPNLALLLEVHGSAERRHDGIDRLAALNPCPRRCKHQQPALKRTHRRVSLPNRRPACAPVRPQARPISPASARSARRCTFALGTVGADRIDRAVVELLRRLRRSIDVTARASAVPARRSPGRCRSLREPRSDRRADLEAEPAAKIRHHPFRVPAFGCI